MKKTKTMSEKRKFVVIINDNDKGLMRSDVEAFNSKEAEEKVLRLNYATNFLDELDEDTLRDFGITVAYCEAAELEVICVEVNPIIELPKPAVSKNRFFLISYNYANGFGSMNYETKGSFPCEKTIVDHVKEVSKGRISNIVVMNIIELSESDHNDFNK